ncbi:RidA family protein [Phyllobacterium sp. YR531]|uniref:RidA family protein n=1 Tax=Phyllobacterium sp. YR531 TaxID=1144343 RepID=UPI00026F75F6|nr:RidA family protein [Phyllobacterium sp. YR531]EJM98878.1 putative translation initiation inhibitor, yjgF family [Phyllobacterium sp. YR531]
MERRKINAADAPVSVGGYSQAVEVRSPERTLYISGQIPVAADGTLPESFGDQARLVWRNIEAQLRAADMSLDNLVKVNVFLADRAYALENRAVRAEILQDRAPAMSVIITEIFDSAWLLEIEAIAVA